VYAKIFASLWDGTLGAHWEGWSVLVYLLANCDPKGVIDATPEAISARSGIPLEAVEKGLRVLEQPDRRSRSLEADGRRIERLDEHRDWGWRIVNYAHYRELVDADTRRAKDLERQRRHREKMAQPVAAQHASRNVTLRHTPSRQAEAEVEVESKERMAPGGVTAAGLARCRNRFPDLDIPLIEAKMLAEHAQHPYRNLDRALLGWCKKAEVNGWDRRPGLEEDPGSGWAQERRREAQRNGGGP
jgi:hypothetical protein